MATKDTTGLSVADLIEALRALKGEDDETLRKRAEYEAEAHARLSKRENEHSTGISAYRPHGGPTPQLRCEMFWVGYPLDADNLTDEEIALFNQAVEGEYRFTRTDGSDEKLTVKVESKANGEPRKVEFYFPCRDQMRHNLPSQAQILREAFGILSLEQQELEALRALVAQSSASAVQMALA